MSVRKRTRGATAALEMRALEIFVAVVDNSSMTRAANRLKLTQPAVSHAVRQLEQDLNATLVDRSIRPLRPTRAGIVLHRRATRLLSDVESLRGAITVANDEALPTIRIGMVPPIAVTGTALIKSLQSIADELCVRSGLTPDLARALLDRELDVLITSDPMSDVAELEREAILHEPFVLALPPRQQRGSLSLKELAETMPLVRYTSRSVTGRTIERHLRRYHVDAPRRLEFDTSAAVLAMVGAGLGWAVTTPLCLLEARDGLKTVAIRPLPGPRLTRNLYLVARRQELPEAYIKIREVATARLTEMLTQAYSARWPWITDAIKYGQEL